MRFKITSECSREYFVYAADAGQASATFEAGKPSEDTRGNAFSLVIARVEEADGSWVTSLQEGPTRGGGTVAGA